MNKQLLPTDFIAVKVYDDGNIVLFKLPEKDRSSSYLCYSIDRLEVLHDELLSYGCEEKISKKAILEAAFQEYNKEVTVK